VAARKPHEIVCVSVDEAYRALGTLLLLLWLPLLGRRHETQRELAAPQPSSPARRAGALGHCWGQGADQHVKVSRGHSMQHSDTRLSVGDRVPHPDA